MMPFDLAEHVGDAMRRFQSNQKVDMIGYASDFQWHAADGSHAAAEVWVHSLE